jgi:hypothetical protein
MITSKSLRAVGGVLLTFVADALFVVFLHENEWPFNVAASIDPPGELLVLLVVRGISIGAGLLAMLPAYRELRLIVSVAYSVLMWFVLSGFELAFSALVYGLYL